MDEQAVLPSGQPKVIRITLNDLESPLFRAVTYEETRAMCEVIITDLKCLQKIYVFKPSYFDRSTISEHLKEIMEEIHLLRGNPSQFASPFEYENFLAKVCALAAETAQIIRAVKNRDQLREEVQTKILEDESQECNPNYLPNLPPWTQFLGPGAPCLPIAHFLSPFETRPPTDISFPNYRHIKSTSVQAIPQAASGILEKWAGDYMEIIDHYRQRHPQDVQFAGPLQRKLIPFRKTLLTPIGLKTEALRLHNLGNRPYGTAVDMFKGQGPQEKATLGRFSGWLEEKDVLAPLTANRCYVVRRWILEKAEAKT